MINCLNKIKSSKKAIVIALIMTCLVKISVAQGTWTAGVSMGKVIPLSTFRSVDIENKNSGFAESGFFWNVDADYYISRNLAVAAKLNLGTTSMNKSANATRLEKPLVDYFDPNNNDASVIIGYWLWREVVLGAKFSTPLNNDKIWIDIAGYGGVNMTQIPDQIVLFNDTIHLQTVNLQNTTTIDYSWVAIASSAVRFSIGSKVQLKINFDYQISKAEYALESYTKTNSDGLKNTFQHANFSIPIKAFNAGIGIVYTIN